jgi:type II secretory pathway pseudopilin PulG
MVACALMSLILTALAINMVYTQRTIKNAQLRAKAVDQANSCMNTFRNLRDSNTWIDFCKRLRVCSDAPNNNQLNYQVRDKPQIECLGFQYTYPVYDPSGYIAGGLSLSDVKDYLFQRTSPYTTHPYHAVLCPKVEFATNNNNAQYEESTYWLDIKGCGSSNNPVEITVYVKYNDYSGNPVMDGSVPRVKVSQKFEKALNEVAIW